ncbi:MAG: hypothetical protein J5858_06575, partial [Lentisphaeria bacterium]|nr:hypothetical protein [Lentisphaeria bacterium]
MKIADPCRDGIGFVISESRSHITVIDFQDGSHPKREKILLVAFPQFPGIAGKKSKGPGIFFGYLLGGDDFMEIKRFVIVNRDLFQWVNVPTGTALVFLQMSFSILLEKVFIDMFQNGSEILGKEVLIDFDKGGENVIVPALQVFMEMLAEILYGSPGTFIPQPALKMFDQVSAFAGD